MHVLVGANIAMNETERVAIVTAAAGGIGQATVQHLLHAGYSVTAVDIDPGALEHLADRLPSDRLHTIPGDMTDTEQVEQVFEAVATQGKLHVLVNGVGSTCDSSLRGISPEAWQRMFELNLTSVFLCIRAALPLLQAAVGDRVIVNISSTLARVADPQTLVYGACKAALEQMTRSLALELAPQRIRVVAVAPGPVTGTGGEAGWEEERFTRLNPLGRFAAPAEVAHMIAFLASPAASYLTGAIYPVDGGDSALGIGWGPLDKLLHERDAE